MNDGRTRVAYALAVGVGLFVFMLGLSVLYATVDGSQTLSVEATSLASAVVGGIVGALAVYLGGSGPDDVDPPASGPGDDAP